MFVYYALITVIQIGGGQQTEFVGKFETEEACQAFVEQRAAEIEEAAHTFHPVKARTDCVRRRVKS